MKWKPLLIANCLLIGCLAPPQAASGKYTVDGIVTGSSRDPGYDACAFAAWLPIDGPPAPRWEGRADITFSRILIRNAASIKRDTTFRSIWVALELVGNDSIAMSLLGPITVALTAGRDSPESFRGTWVCDDHFPFADDSSIARLGHWGILTY